MEILTFLVLTPLLLPTLLVIVGGILGAVFPYLSWIPRVGLFLFTQVWWWFPVGPIVGLILFFNQ